MKGIKIKWGNVIIFLLIIAAGVAAFYYRDSQRRAGLFSFISSKTEKVSGKLSSEKAKSASDVLVMGLDSWIGSTPALIALDRGYNNDYMLNMELKYITNDRDRITELKNGTIHVTEMTLPAFLKFQSEFPNSGIIVGITDFSRGADGIIAKEGINTLNDMEGKTVSYVSDGIGKFILNKFLRLTGLRYQDIKALERKEMSDVVDDLKNGRADLIVSWSPDMNITLKEMNASKPGSVKMLITTKEVPDLVPTVLVVNKSVADKYPEKVEAFLKTWYVSAKYIIEKPDKAYERLAALMSEKDDIYGNVSIDDVKESFENIKLMSLNDNFSYFGLDGKERKVDYIITDTIKTWQKFGDMPESNIQSNILADTYMKHLFKENDQELLVGAIDSSISGNAQVAVEEKKQFTKQDEISIEQNTEMVAKIDIPPVYYDSGMATVREESKEVLNEVVSILKQFPEYYLIIDAHTDSVGSDEFNLKLSKDRAETVKLYLISQGIDENRLVARGWGEYRPVVAQELTEEDMAKNRRTEFILTRTVN